MPRKKLEETLRALADEIEGADDIDANAADDIRGAIQEIREALDGDDAGPFEVLRQRVTQVAENFEDSNPTLARNLGRISDLLARIGI